MTHSEVISASTHLADSHPDSEEHFTGVLHHIADYLVRQEHLGRHCRLLE